MDSVGHEVTNQLSESRKEDGHEVRREMTKGTREGGKLEGERACSFSAADHNKSWCDRYQEAYFVALYVVDLHIYQEI